MQPEYHILEGDCLDVLKSMETESVDALVTDPPAGISFMNAKWDSDKGSRNQWIAWLTEVMEEALRVMKPGAHGLVWALPRTSHWTGMALEDAGFEVRERLAHIFGSGFPKSLNVQKAAQKADLACKCPDGAVYSHNGIQPEDMRVVRSGVDAADSVSGGEKQDVFPGVQPGTPELCEAGNGTQARPDMPVVQSAVPTQEQASAGQSEVLLSDVRGAAPDTNAWRDGANAPNSRERAGQDSTGEGSGGRKESSLEGRGNIPAGQGELQGAALRSVPEGISTDGPQGRIHNGASSSNGDALGAAPEQNGSGTSHRPRSEEQRPGESTTLRHERGAQTCGGCGKAIVPPGLGTALKPATEDWWLIRKPLSESSVARNVLKWDTGAINIDACRVEGTVSADARNSAAASRIGGNGIYHGSEGTAPYSDNPHPESARHNASGRWPPNLVLSHSPDCNGECVAGCPVRVMDEQSGTLKSGEPAGKRTAKSNMLSPRAGEYDLTGYGDSGGASRFFPRFETDEDFVPFKYQAKASRAERNKGLEGMPETEGDYSIRNGICANCGKVWIDGKRNGACCAQPERTSKATIKAANTHPTVKPLSLMRWLVRLVTPPNGTVLDPFAGSGTTLCAATLEGFDSIGIEQSPEYAEIARRRVEYWSQPEEVRANGTKAPDKKDTPTESPKHFEISTLF